MKLIIKLLTLFIVIAAATNSCFAISVNKLDKLVSKSELNDISTISISIRNVQTGKVIYEKDAKKLLHPASTIKVPTAFFAVNSLGYDYLFKTQFYTHNNDLYIKLGADPLLRTSQLREAFQAIKKEDLNSFNNIYIDDSIIDKKEFSQGWMWDDDINPYTPKVSSYNLDSNIIKVNVTSMEDGTIKATSSSKYPMSIFAYIQKNPKLNYFDINRYNWNNPELIEIYATTKNPQPIYVPISSMRRYFIYNIDKMLEDERITVKYTSYASRLVPADAQMVYEILNPIAPTLSSVLRESNNLKAETLYKLAGGKAYNATGSDNIALQAMTDFYKKYDIDFNNVIIKDGCGVSRNNLVSAEWMTNILSRIYKDENFEYFKKYMTEPGEGTLSQRLYDLRGDAWLKTGSLANVSAISGYINSKDSNTYAITVFIQNFPNNPKEIKNFEDEIIKLIYDK